MTTKLKKLRYSLLCSIGDLGIPGVHTGPLGYTDDLETAIWHAEHSPAPYWEVYDQASGNWLLGPSPAMTDRMMIERLIKELSTPWELHQEGASEQIDTKSVWIETFPGWRPASQQVIAPLRVALYAAVSIERARREDSEPPGKLAHYPDGRDLELDWVWEMKSLRRDLYFRSPEEANKWLSFEPKDGAVWHEMKAEFDRSEPEHLAEWNRWLHVHSVKLRRQAQECGEKIPPLRGQRSLG
jgi:hypothetical protein